MVEALAEAQKLAFAPLAFQAVRAMLLNGMLEYVAAHEPVMRSALASRYSRYVADVLVESGVTSGVLQEQETRKPPGSVSFMDRRFSSL